MTAEQVQSQPISVGFTGTREGMTREQWETVYGILGGLDVWEVHHGDCVGADSDLQDVATHHELRVVIHPPADDRLRAFRQGDESYPPKDYLARNRDIVDDTDLLVATPKEDKEQDGGGTWYTVRYARKQDKPVIVVWPDGTYERTEGEADDRH